MCLSRREFGVRLAGLASVAGFGLPQLGFTLQRRSGEPAILFSRLQEGVHVAVGQGGNSLILINESGDRQAMLVDCKTAGYGTVLKRGVLGCIEEEPPDASVDDPSPLDLQLIVNTHHHSDHTGGNHAFVGSVNIIAHERCLKRVPDNIERYKQAISATANVIDREDWADANTKREIKGLARHITDLDETRFLPNLKMTNRHDVTVGPIEVALEHVEAGHTDNDVFVHVPSLNLLHTGDLVFNQLHPFVDVPGGANTRGWQKSCERMLELCDEKTVVIPGHGPVADRKAIEAQIRYFESVRRQVRRAIDAGKSRSTISRTGVTGFEDYGFTQIQSRVLNAVFEELMAEPAG